MVTGAVAIVERRFSTGSDRRPRSHQTRRWPWRRSNIQRRPRASVTACLPGV